MLHPTTGMPRGDVSPGIILKTVMLPLRQTVVGDRCIVQWIDRVKRQFPQVQQVIRIVVSKILRNG